MLHYFFVKRTGLDLCGSEATLPKSIHYCRGAGVIVQTQAVVVVRFQNSPVKPEQLVLMMISVHLDLARQAGIRANHAVVLDKYCLLIVPYPMSV